MHHSDRGVQYAAHGYVDLLKQHKITISMSRKANPYDNAKAESFMKTLKYELLSVPTSFSCGVWAKRKGTGTERGVAKL